MKGEIWKPVVGYENLYEVSNLGRVKSLERMRRCGNGGYYKMPERILKAEKNNCGYLTVGLYKEGRRKYCKIHRLVAESFLPNPNNLPCVNHIDENKLNNIVDNLEFCSYSYNNSYNGKAKKVGKKLRGRKQSEETKKKIAEKLRGRKQSEERVKKMSKPVFSVNKVSGLVTYWESANEASRQLGIRQGNITECCQGKRKSAGNHYWFYADDDDNE